MKFTKLLMLILTLSICIFFEGLLNDIMLYEILQRMYFSSMGAFFIWFYIKLELWEIEDRLEIQKSVDKIN